MKTIVELFSAVVLLAGVAMGIYAFTIPSRFPMTGASAIQITQVYSQATFYAVLSVSLLVLAGVLILSLQGRKE